MPVFVKNGMRWNHEQRVRKAACRDAQLVRPLVGHPIHRGAAVRAKMKVDLEPGIGSARIDLAHPLGSHLLLREIRTEMNRGAGATLARFAVAQIGPFRLPLGNRTKRTAMTLRNSLHATSPLAECVVPAAPRAKGISTGPPDGQPICSSRRQVSRRPGRCAMVAAQERRLGLAVSRRSLLALAVVDTRHDGDPRLARVGSIDPDARQIGQRREVGFTRWPCHPEPAHLDR